MKAKNFSPTADVKSSIGNNSEIVRSLKDVNRIPVRLHRSIAGQLALVSENRNSELIAIPLTLYSKGKEIILGIEHIQHSFIWGSQYGHWAQDSDENRSRLEYPMGLSILVPINKLFVSVCYIRPKVSNSEFKKIKVYYIRDILGDIVFVGKERINYKVRYLCGVSTQIDLKLYDAFKREVIFCRKLLKFGNCLSSCCLNCMQVMAQESKLIGNIKQNWSPFRTQYSVCDKNHKTLFRLKSTKSGFSDKSQAYKIFSVDSKPIGEIKPSLREKFYTKNFKKKEIPILSIDFIESLHPINKTQLIAAMFLIKYLYYK